MVKVIEADFKSNKIKEGDLLVSRSLMERFEKETGKEFPHKRMCEKSLKSFEQDTRGEVIAEFLTLTNPILEKTKPKNVTPEITNVDFIKFWIACLAEEMRVRERYLYEKYKADMQLCEFDERHGRN